MSIAVHPKFKEKILNRFGDFLIGSGAYPVLDDTGTLSDIRITCEGKEIPFDYKIDSKTGSLFLIFDKDDLKR